MKHDMMESEKDKNGKQSYDEMCSLGYGTSEKMCSSSNNATCGSRMLSTSGEYVEIPYCT